jgi:putative membrane protein
MGERLHPAAIAVYAADALRQGAVPLLVLLGISVFGGGFDAQAALRGVGFALAGTAVAALAGGLRWATTRYSLAGSTVRLRQGLLSVKEVEIPFARVQAVDVQQGPTQRLFGVLRVDVQTGGGGEGGEIVLNAVDAAEVERIRALLGRPAAAADARVAERRLSGRELAVAAATSGQLGVLVPVAAGVAQLSQQLFDDPLEGERTIAGALPDGTLGWVLLAAGVIALAWLLAALGTVVGFGGFAVRREGEELRIRRGLLQRRQVTLRVARVRAVRVVESVPRQALGLAALRVEVIGHAKEQAAAQTLFPLLRRDAIEPFLRELLPEHADRLDGLAAPPARARRRYVLPPLAATALLAGVAALATGSPWPLLLAPLGALYGALGFRAAGWRLEDGRLAVRSRRLARTTVLAMTAAREFHELDQTALQRRARLADVAVAFGKGTTARIRHLDAGDAWELWAAIGPRWGAVPDVRRPRSPYRRAMNSSTLNADAELKARHRKMWASGSYPVMVETFLTPLGPRLAEACRVGPGTRVLDVAAGTGNAAIPAALAGADVTASDLTPELLDAGRARAETAGAELQWVQADAEHLPFEDASFDVVMSAIGVMFAPHHQLAADELVRVLRPGGRLGLLSWTPEGMIGALFRTMGPFAPPPPPGAQPPPLWGGEAHLRELLGDRVALDSVERDVLEVTAFERARDYGEHFKAYYGPTIAAQNNARNSGREDEFVAALDAFCDEWNRTDSGPARFEMEYLLAVGTRR